MLLTQLDVHVLYCGKNIDKIVKDVNHELENMVDWLRCNILFLNISKSN